MLADLDPETRQRLGIGTPCAPRPVALPVVEIARRKAPENDPPGAAWLRTGLHRLRVPRRSSARAEPAAACPDGDG
jgi:hypothetical protein